MSADTTDEDRYKAQVHDVVLNAFFKLRELDSRSLKRSKVDVGWDIAEAFVAAAVGGVTYKSQSRERWFEAAQMLREFADQLESNGLRDLKWGYRGDLLARHAWRPDLRTAAGQEEVRERVQLMLEACDRPLRAQTVAERQAVIALIFISVGADNVRVLLDPILGELETLEKLDIVVSDLLQVICNVDPSQPSEVGDAAPRE